MVRKYHDTFYEGDFYHIYNRGINQEIIFKSERNYLFFLQRWDKYLSSFLDVYSYCLVPTHYHFFARVKELNSFTKLQKFSKAAVEADADAQDQTEPTINEILENQFKNFLRSYALAFNKENRRTGSLIQKGFKRIRVDDVQYFTAIIHYIHNNPIHHKYTDDYEKWPYSSYSAILSDKATKVKKEEILEWFGSREDFIEYHLDNIKYEKINKFLFG